jgi:hypothetical protein
MVSINYIISTYSGSLGKKRINKLDPLCLQIQFEKIYEKKNTLIKQITVVCPPIKDAYPEYYQKEKWIKLFGEKGIKIVFMDYIGDNTHFSYDQYILAYLKYPNFDYYIVMEDDYYMNLDNYDVILVDQMKKKCINGEGFLCSASTKTPGRTNDVAHVSNGIISKKAWENVNKNGTILQDFYEKIVPKGIPQIKFSRLFGRIEDHGADYRVLFWHSPSRVIRTITKSPKPDLINPVQVLYKDTKFV